MINKNLVKAVFVTLAATAYLFLAAYLGYTYLPAGFDASGHRMHGLMAFLAILVALGIIAAVAGFNYYFNNREVEEKERLARIARMGKNEY